MWQKRTAKFAFLFLLFSLVLNQNVTMISVFIASNGVTIKAMEINNKSTVDRLGYSSVIAVLDSVACMDKKYSLNCSMNAEVLTEDSLKIIPCPIYTHTHLYIAYSITYNGISVNEHYKPPPTKLFS